MNDVVTQPGTGPLGAISRFFAPMGEAKDALGAGIQASFGLIGYKGKVWSLRYRGENNPLMRKDGDGPQSSIEVVIVKAPEHLSKIFYEAGYVDGSNAPPDCFSNNGVAPDPTSKKKQNNVCQTCKQNAWGSRVVTAGGRTSSGKACSDSKRLAVTPLSDIDNEAMGGPMLLRVPPASLQDLALYGSALTKYGYPYYAVATRISFDTKESYPKFVFQAIRALTDDEAKKIIEIQKRPLVERILAETGEGAAEAADAIPEQAAPSPFEQAAPQQTAPQQTTPAPEVKTQLADPPQQQAQQEVTPQSNPFTNGATTTLSQGVVNPSEIENDLDKMLSKLIPAQAT